MHVSFPPQIPAETHGETRSFSSVTEFPPADCLEFPYELGRGASSGASERDSLVASTRRALWGAQESRTGSPGFSPSQRELIPLPGVPHLASLISPVGLLKLTACCLSSDSRISSSLVVTAAGWRGRDARSPVTISHYFNTESLGHAAQAAVTQVHALCPQAGGSAGIQGCRS